MHALMDAAKPAKFDVGAMRIDGDGAFHWDVYGVLTLNYTQHEFPTAYATVNRGGRAIAGRVVREGQTMREGRAEVRHEKPWAEALDTRCDTSNFYYTTANRRRRLPHADGYGKYGDMAGLSEFALWRTSRLESAKTSSTRVVPSASCWAGNSTHRRVE